MKESWFIKNKKLLDEFYREDDLLDLEKEQVRLFWIIQDLENSWLVWVIGNYGEWKSTFLNQLRRLPVAKWFEFDAWKYPERSNLWENFILEIARQINQAEFDKTICLIDWETHEAKKTLINTIGDIPLLWAIKNFNYFFKTTPARRTFELQNVLIDLLKSIEEKNIYIIIEDIDRSWDSWVYFLETFNHFLKTIEVDKKIVGFVPIWMESYEKQENQSSYFKSIDYFYEFSLRNINLTKFVEAVFDDEILSNKYHKWQIITFLESLFKEYQWQMNMRKLKMILRNANSKYISLYRKHWEWIDWRLAIIFETARHIKNDKNESFLTIWRTSKEIHWFNSTAFLSLISCIAEEWKHAQSKWMYHNPPYESIYKSEYINGINEDKLIGFEYRFPIKFKDISYKESEVKDSVFFHASAFSSERDKNYFSIITDYLY